MNLDRLSATAVQLVAERNLPGLAVGVAALLRCVWV
jgi:hypothetical protein